MPTRYFGQKTKEFGRPLWEIVLNLKDFGVGRYALRSTLKEKYPEPCFFRILEVQPHKIEYPVTNSNYCNMFFFNLLAFSYHVICYALLYTISFIYLIYI